MNEVINAILSRRSIRSYTNKNISKQDMDLILKSAMYAPTARNLQYWRFLVIQDKTNMAKLENIQPYNTLLNSANAAIIVCSEMENEVAQKYFMQDCGASIQNIMLAATSLGIGSITLGLHSNADQVAAIKEQFNMPQNIMPVGIVALGYPNEEKPDPGRFDESKIHYEKW